MQSYKNYRIQRTVTLLFFQRANHKHSKYSLTTIKEQESQQKKSPQRKSSITTEEVKSQHSENQTTPQ